MGSVIGDGPSLEPIRCVPLADSFGYLLYSLERAEYTAHMQQFRGWRYQLGKVWMNGYIPGLE